MARARDAKVATCSATQIVANPRSSAAGPSSRRESRVAPGHALGAKSPIPNAVAGTAHPLWRGHVECLVTGLDSSYYSHVTSSEQQPEDNPGRQRRPPHTEQRPHGRTEVREALLDAAQRLIADRGPTRVTLREIADEAGVNFGLVYQYLGTRESLLREVYQRVAARSAVLLGPVDRLADAIAALMTIPGTSTARLMAWTALDRTYPAGV